MSKSHARWYNELPRVKADLPGSSVTCPEDYDDVKWLMGWSVSDLWRAGGLIKNRLISFF